MMRGNLLLLFMAGALLWTNNLQSQRNEYRIGFSQCVSDDFWRETMEKEMEIELSLYPDMALIKRDAGGDSQQQIRDVRELLDEDIDLLIISPNESEPLTPIVEEVYNSGIPVVIIDRQINSDSWTAYIGADNYEIGFQAGQYAASILSESGKILEIMGLEGSSPAFERHQGFVDAIRIFPDVTITNSYSGKWVWAGGKAIMDSLLVAGIRPDLVFSHNDFMAAGAYEAAATRNLSDEFIFLGIDGLPGEEGGIQYVIDGKLDATWLYPTGGDKAIDVARKILQDKPFERQTKLQTLLVDSRNANTLKLQNEQLASLQEKIQRQRIIAGRYLEQISNLRLMAIMISLFTFIVLLLIVLVIRAYRGKQKANEELEKQNVEIEKQNEQLQKITAQLEIATQQKLRFFTNISHEFRTPLTLMSGPLESLIHRDDLPEGVTRQLEMMYRNAHRLLRLINQVMDFRKLENNKMLLQAARYDIIKFLKSIKENFDSLAEKRKISFSFDSRIVSRELWFDMDKLDKVMFNLLSNAFKFTAEGGQIGISFTITHKVINGEKREVAEIAVKDDGRGMSEEHVQRIFERFYQIEQQREGNYFPGTGLGLSLSKSLIELHSGAIEVESTKGEGTTFFVYLQTGDDHLSQMEKVTVNDHQMEEPVTSSYLSEDLQFFSTGPDVETDKDGLALPTNENAHLLLIVEDNQDLRKYMQEILVDQFEVITARDGAEAWEVVQRELPDLVISDVMMPHMNGLELTAHIKKDLKTCHIPVILLTAKTSVENKLEGLEAGADSYIPKPFNERHLMIRVRKFLEMRNRINEHYKEYLSFTEIENPVARMDQRFLDKTAKLIEDHINDQSYGVEELSREIGMSRVHLYRKVKQITGFSVSDYVRSVKLRVAKQLIRNGEMNISEVAYASGFSNPSYFTKCFKSQFNQSPSEYKSQFTEH